MPVDTALLKQIGQWRLLLAESLAAHNDLNQQTLNSAVRRIIDQLLVLRICEVRGLQRSGSLREIVVGENSLSRLNFLFAALNDRFRVDSGPSRREPGDVPSSDREHCRLRIDQRVMRTIVDDLDDPESRGVFANRGATMLGQVHETFLDQIIQCEQESDSVRLQRSLGRKQGGVYYTPDSVVRYIVDRTLAPWLREASQTHAVDDPRVLDPSCGAGAFLIAAYQRLLDWYRQWYIAHDPATHRRRIRRTAQGDWALTYRERERILLASIYGIDLDRQAVQVTRLCLLLKLLEDEHASASDWQAELFNMLALPDLSQNVRWGDSLVGTAGSGSGGTLPGNVVSDASLDLARAFPDVFGREDPGFDVVIGNPPYINVRLLAQTVDQRVRQYLSDTYRCATGLYDIYVLFVERSLDLLRTNGRFGMIVPNKIATLDYARACRELLKRETTIEEVTDVSSMRVFGSAGVYPYLLFWRKRKPEAGHCIQVRSVQSAADLCREEPPTRLPQSSLSTEDGFAFHGRLDVESRVATVPLSQLARIHSGTTGFSAGQMADSLVEATDVGKRDCYGFIVSGNIDRYRIDLGQVRFQHTDYVQPVLSRDEAWLSDNKRRLYGGEKLVIAGMTKRLEVAWDPGGLALGVQVYAAADLKEDSRYLLGILNSRLISYLFRQRFAAKHLAGGYLAINKGQLEKIPIRRIDASRDRSRRRRLIQLVTERLELELQLPSRIADDEQKRLQHAVLAADQRIDDVVFELYGVTDDERQWIDAA